MSRKTASRTHTPLNAPLFCGHPPPLPHPGPQGAVREFFMGSVSHFILNNCKCPVVVVRNHC